IGPGVRFQADGRLLSESEKDYEKRVRQQFKEYLRYHRQQTRDAFKSHGYKQQTKPPSVEGVKWLAISNVRPMSRSQLLTLMDEADPSGYAGIDQKGLEYRFRQYKRYQLPVRR